MEDILLKQVLDRYRTSRDFNGLYFKAELEAARTAAAELVRSGLVQVVSEEDYPNPHIRPWPSKRSVEQQIGSIQALTATSYGVCLYPTPLALKQHRTRRTYADQPFRRDMAAGRGTLELAYFRFDVLEQYRNDPRFVFDFYDFGARAVIGDAAYSDSEEPDHDKIIMDHIGFAYDLSRYKREDPDSPVIRRVCAFYGDLAKLTPTHQQRWKTYQVEQESLQPHPVWWGQQMGHWPDGLGPFEQLFFELESLNTLHERAFGSALFRTAERPGAFGWILRPSQQEWDGFIHELDKLLSENLRHDALDMPGVPRKDEAGMNIGTLNRLATLLITRKVPDKVVKSVLKPLREVRQARQRPAHALRANVTDKTFVHKQVHLLDRVSQSLHELRGFWQTHPANSDWKPRYSEMERGYRM